jgi:hypothetical protein
VAGRNEGEMKGAAIIIGAALVVLGIGAFIAWDINPGNWTEAARGTVAILSAGAAVMAAILTKDRLF